MRHAVPVREGCFTSQSWVWSGLHFYAIRLTPSVLHVLALSPIWAPHTCLGPAAASDSSVNGAGSAEILAKGLWIVRTLPKARLMGTRSACSMKTGTS